jgi:hypothetical protein
MIQTADKASLVNSQSMIGRVSAAFVKAGVPHDPRSLEVLAWTAPLERVGL